MEQVGTLTRNGTTVTVQFSVDYDATPEELWSAITEPPLLEKWLAQAEFDARVSGAVHLVWPGQGDMRGVVLRADAPHRLSYTWREGDGKSEIDFDVEGISDTTSRLTLTHRGTTEKDAPGLGAGWHSHLESLSEVLSDGDTSAAIRDARYEELRPRYQDLLS
jgi:uncharacterized protein YndB with AHSA1/START domain